MARETFDRYAWPVILAHEVGPFLSTGGLVDDPADSGGITKWGISFRYLRSLPREFADTDGDGDVDANDIRGLTEEQARAIYYRWWQRLRLDTSWPDAMPVCVKFFDAAVNMGDRRATELLQKAVAAASMGEHRPVVDGALGPKTRRAVRETLRGIGDSEERLLTAFRACQADFYYRIAGGNRRKFLAGWLNRAYS